MADARLTDDEARILRDILSVLVVRDRTGELGIFHGLQRFVSTQRPLTKAERDSLDRAARKLGLASGLALYRG